MDEKITYQDVLEYQHLFSLAPSFILERMARKNSNLVSKFKPRILSELDKLDENHRNKLNIILNSDVSDLQAILNEAYIKSNKKQFKILANPKYKDFLELNLAELRKLV